MVLPDVPSTIFEGEAELALVIGKRAKKVKAEDAMKYIFGYMNFIDGSARGLLPTGNTFYQMKSRDTFVPIGPYIVTADSVQGLLFLRIKSGFLHTYLISEESVPQALSAVFANEFHVPICVAMDHLR